MYQAGMAVRARHPPLPLASAMAMWRIAGAVFVARRAAAGRSLARSLEAVAYVRGSISLSAGSMVQGCPGAECELCSIAIRSLGGGACFRCWDCGVKACHIVCWKEENAERDKPDRSGEEFLCRACSVALWGEEKAELSYRVIRPESSDSRKRRLERRDACLERYAERLGAPRGAAGEAEVYFSILRDVGLTDFECKEGPLCAYAAGRSWWMWGRAGGLGGLVRESGRAAKATTVDAARREACAVRLQTANFLGKGSLSGQPIAPIGQVIDILIEPAGKRHCIGKRVANGCAAGQPDLWLVRGVKDVRIKTDPGASGSTAGARKTTWQALIEWTASAAEEADWWIDVCGKDAQGRFLLTAAVRTEARKMIEARCPIKRRLKRVAGGSAQVVKIAAISVGLEDWRSRVLRSRSRAKETWECKGIDLEGESVGLAGGEDDIKGMSGVSDLDEEGRCEVCVTDEEGMSDVCDMEVG